MREINKGATDVMALVRVLDNSKTDGSALTGLVYNTSGLTCYYVRPGSAAAAVSLVTQTVTGAHSDGGFVEIDATNMPGVYRLDLPDAVCASGVEEAVVVLRGATNMASVALGIVLKDATPDANVTQIGGVAQSATDLKDFADAGYDPATHKVEAVKVNDDMRGTDSANTVVPDAAGVAPTASEIQTELEAAGSSLAAILVALGTVENLGTGATLAKNLRDMAGATFAYTMDNLEDVRKDVATAQTDLDTITGSDGTTLATAQGNYAPNTVVPDAAGTAPTASEIQTELEAVGSYLALIKAVTDLLPDSGALSSLATGANLATVDGVVDAIKVVTDNLADTLEDDLGVQRFTANALEEAPSGSGGDATEAKQDTILSNVATVDGVVDAIKTVTDALPDSGALSSLATAAAIAALNDISVANVLAGVVDGAVDVETALKRILATVAGSCAASGTDPKTLAYKNSAGTATVATHSIPTDGSGRTSSF